MSTNDATDKPPKYDANKRFTEKYLKNNVHAIKIKVELDPNSQITGTLDGFYNYNSNSNPKSGFTSIYTTDKFYITEELLEKYKELFIKNPQFQIKQLLLSKPNLIEVIKNIPLLRRKISKSKASSFKPDLENPEVLEKRVFENDELFKKKFDDDEDIENFYQDNIDDNDDDDDHDDDDDDDNDKSKKEKKPKGTKDDNDNKLKLKKEPKGTKNKVEKLIKDELVAKQEIVKNNLNTIKNLFFKDGYNFIIDGVKFVISNSKIESDPNVLVGDKKLSIKKYAKDLKLSYSKLRKEVEEDGETSGTLSFRDARYINRLIESLANKKIKNREAREDIKKFNIKYVFTIKRGISVAPGSLDYYKIIQLELNLIPVDEYYLTYPIKNYCLKKSQEIISLIRDKLKKDLDIIDDSSSAANILPEEPLDVISTNYKNYIKRIKAQRSQERGIIGGSKYKGKTRRRNKKIKRRVSKRKRKSKF